MPDNNTTPPKSPEQLELEKQEAIAKLKNSIAQEQAGADKAIADERKNRSDDLRGQLKGPDVTALSGNITSDGTFIESRILARRTLERAFAALGNALKSCPEVANASPVVAGKPAVKLILYNAADIPSIELFIGLRAQLTVLENHYKQVNEHVEKLLKAASRPQPARSGSSGKADLESTPESMETIKGPVPFTGALPGLAALSSGPVMAGFAGAALLRTAIDLASLFRVNTDFKNFDLPVDDTALTAEFRKAIPAGWKLYHPAQFPVLTINNTGPADSAFLEILRRLQEENSKATDLLGNINNQLKDLNTALATEPDASKRAGLQRQVDAFNKCPDPINTLNAAFTQIQGLLSSVDTTTRTSTLTILLRSERLLGVMHEEGAFVVKLAAISKGSNKITQWLWSRAVIRHSAGTELNCLVFAPDGSIVFANTQLKYTPYIKAEDIEA